jgi:aminopeptidase N
MRYLVLFFLLFPGLSFATSSYQLDLELFPDKQSLEATAVIELDSRAPHLVLRLAEEAELLMVEQGGNRLEHRFSAGILKIKLDNRQPLKISYRGRFTDQASSIPIHNEDPSYGVTAGISPKGTFLSAAADWYPRPATDDVFYRLTVTAPAGVEAVTSGQRTARYSESGKTVSTWETDYPLYGLTLSAGRYQVFEDLSTDIPIYAYFYAESAQLAQLYLQSARDYLALYEDLFGPYPYNKFAIVENFFPTGYGFPSWTLLGSSVIRLPFIVETSLGHEIAHSWWGTGVRVDYSQGNWSEGLTTYVADHLYKEQESSAAGKEYRLKILRDYAGLVNNANRFPVSKFLSRHDKASQSIGYGKAAMLFHMLRQQVGDELFWSTLKKIAQQNMFQQIGWSDFEHYYSRAAQQDLSDFFQQWLQREDGPNLSLKDVSVTKTSAGYRTTGVLQQSRPVYQLNVDLAVTTASGTTTHRIASGQSAENFQLTTAEKPLQLSLDQDANMFRILHAAEIPPTTNSVRGSRELMAVKAERFVPPDAAITRLLGALRKSDLPVKSISELSEKDLAAKDLLVFGESDELANQLVENGEIRLAGGSEAFPGKSAFVVSRHPKNPKRVAAWFVSADPENAAVAARKIPHYGKYSYLLFAGGTNILKGTFVPEDSPLVINLADD